MDSVNWTCILATTLLSRMFVLISGLATSLLDKEYCEHATRALHFKASDLKSLSNVSARYLGEEACFKSKGAPLERAKEV